MTAVARIIDDLHEKAGLQGKDIANIVGASPAAVSRWSNGASNPNLDTQSIIADLRYVVERLAEFYTPTEARLWLHSSHPLLDGVRPIDAISTGNIKAVLATIEKLSADIYL